MKHAPRQVSTSLSMQWGHESCRIREPGILALWDANHLEETMGTLSNAMVGLVASLVFEASRLWITTAIFLLAFLCITCYALAETFISSSRFQKSWRNDTDHLAALSYVAPSSSDLHVQDQNNTMIVKTSNDCTQLLKARTLPGCSFENNLSPLQSRAGPNQLLVTAFDISNCFVTPSATICSAFRSEASKLIKLDDEGWREMRDIVAISLKTHIPASKDTIKVVPKVQFITMKLVLHALCGHGGDPADDQRIYKLASEVNRQWIWSKTGNMSTGSRLPNIRRTLGELLPEWKEADFPAAKNPLNLLIPGYETTWRVVLRGLI